MSEEKPKGVLERNAHTIARGGEAVAVVSLLLLVPFLHRRREQRHGRWRRHFAILMH